MIDTVNVCKVKVYGMVMFQLKHNYVLVLFLTIISYVMFLLLWKPSFNNGEYEVRDEFYYKSCNLVTM